MPAYYNSRLSRKQDQRAILQIALTAGITIIILAVFVLVGLPWLFNLSGQLINLKNKNNTQQVDKSLAVVAPPTLQADFSATPSGSIKIRGFSESNDNITIYGNGNFLTNLIADSDGKFTVDVDLNSGENKFTAQATNKSGDKSAFSDALTITRLNKLPKLEVNQPKENQSFSNVDSIQIQGTTDVNVTVTVNGRSAIVGSDGKFSYFYRLNQGDNNLKFEATDQAGNKTTKEFKVTSD